ncbi:ADP-ribosylation/crystallin J1 [Aquimarina sp. MMG015]|uniref:ADP-ribosylation/crystallin J1 n=1 Tax=unclassified Aquimarina TaxID=2627091 RepID=UPI000E54A8F4|nr:MULTISPECIES: ADP-ribosylation/crystallin J1 [unclassified Aquimarina]AXT56033.1 ADP-ribosylation/crystallin J1 [Aquimarina sp. AD1]MBQ4803879.1 ADP-ribosylation/crystallin J1 [Aquimarina sp. MMG015]RKN28442.1 ADP-ribosylation/crystallin J1 [Aquimarina sp. AD1]
MKTITLYRPVGLKELELIHNTGWKYFPQRLSWQPIFYPVMNEVYAIEIATKWNLDDEGSGYSGFVTTFDMNESFLKKYKVENVGGPIHNELWIPAEELEEFNENIVGEIRVTKTYFGQKYTSPENEELKRIIEKNENKYETNK